ncbi:hypothetical protein BDN72DRAFT_964754 [Pluteus cervinus]|uniref:Uncharacterized protein n=1 Tax=Pluteus cervinus TaxID=181527 RepID=A0ACD3A8R4_9AGAR|nr:hypothetical protein BDN72DRAFT_964754 [Pluteus cervinus]
MPDRVFRAPAYSKNRNVQELEDIYNRSGITPGNVAGGVNVATSQAPAPAATPGPYQGTPFPPIPYQPYYTPSDPGTYVPAGYSTPSYPGAYLPAPYFPPPMNLPSSQAGGQQQPQQPADPPEGRQGFPPPPGYSGYGGPYQQWAPQGGHQGQPGPTQGPPAGGAPVRQTP